MTVRDIYNLMDSIAPFDSACGWDNCGLVIGDMDAEVTSVYVTLDADRYALERAREYNCTLVISHHPVIFDPMRKLTIDDICYHYIKSGISVISSHTCLDAADGGINDELADRLLMKNVQPIIEDGVALGRYGTVNAGAEYIEKIKRAVGSNRANTYICRDIKKVASVSGSGGSLIECVKALGCDTLITGEAKHEHFVYAHNNNINLITLGHFETENIIIKPLCERLSKLTDKVIFIPSERTEFINVT